MYKNNQKRYEYDIGSNGPEEIERYAYKYPNSKVGSEHVSYTATPINRKSIISHQPVQERIRNHDSFHQYENRFHQRNEDSYVVRGKANSTSAMKKTTNKHYEMNDKSYLAVDNSKQTKKIFFGAEGLYSKQPQFKNTKAQLKINDQNKRFNGENVHNSYHHERFEQPNKRGQSKDFQKQKKFDMTNTSHESNINEKQIMEKIGRINRLNQEINNRLQRMLSKIDS